MSRRDRDPRSAGPAPDDSPRFSSPAGAGGAPQVWGRSPRPGERPAFDPTRPLTGPGSASDAGSASGGQPPYGTPPGRPGQPGQPGRRPGGSGPRRRLAPTLITAGVLVLALIVIGGGVLIARYRDAHAGTASGRPSTGSTAADTGTPSAGATPGSPGSSTSAGGSANSIAFSDSQASGTMTVLAHQWSTTGDPEPVTGSYLSIEVELKIDQGSMYYSPEMFQAFDAVGNVSLNDEHTAQQPLLTTGHAEQGQAVRGWVNFDTKRGDTTLLLVEDANPIAALKITD